MDEFDNVSLVKKENTYRVNTGLDRLDELLSGGFPNNSITLVSGTPGSGKTIICYHYIAEGLKKGEKCLYLTSDERVESILNQAKEVGFDFRSYVDTGQLRFMYLDLDKNTTHKEMEDEINRGDYSRVVLDSLTPVTEVPVWVSGVKEVTPSNGLTENKYPAGSIPATRLHIKRIFNILNQNNCTSLVTSEIKEGSRNLSRDTILSLIHI